MVIPSIGEKDRIEHVQPMVHRTRTYQPPLINAKANCGRFRGGCQIFPLEQYICTFENANPAWKRRVLLLSRRWQRVSTG